jgi:hypothetical protein
MKQAYPGVVQGTDVKGNTMRVYVDVDGIYSMDSAAEDAMKANLLARWKRVWSQNHPHEHGRVTVEIRDFKDKLMMTERAVVLRRARPSTSSVLRQAQDDRGDRVARTA